MARHVTEIASDFQVSKTKGKSQTTGLNTITKLILPTYNPAPSKLAHWLTLNSINYSYMFAFHQLLYTISYNCPFNLYLRFFQFAYPIFCRIFVLINVLSSRHYQIYEWYPLFPFPSKNENEFSAYCPNLFSFPPIVVPVMLPFPIL